jgi:hypothetical protein
MAHNHAEPHATGDGPGYELRDVNPRSLLMFGGVLIAFLTLLLFGMLNLYKLFVNEKEPKEVVGARAPGNIYDVLHNLRESEKARLTSYGWVDRKAGTVRIPIERAMDLVAERGVPHGKGPRTEAELNSHAGVSAEQADAQPKAKDAKPPATDAKAQEKDGKK